MVMMYVTWALSAAWLVKSTTRFKLYKLVNNSTCNRLLNIANYAQLAACRSIGKSVSSSCPQRDLSQTQFSGVKDMLNQVNYQTIALKYRIEVSSITSFKAHMSSYTCVTRLHFLVISSNHHVSLSAVTEQPFHTLPGWYAGLYNGFILFKL